MTKNLVNQRETGEYNKFYVDRVDERDAPGGDRHGADYLVLDLTFDKHVMAGLKAYADAVEKDYPLLAADLRRRIPQDAVPIVDEFTQYRRSQIAELTPWTPETKMNFVSISTADLLAGSPKAGDMIARNPKNHNDKWLVAKQYFEDNFEPLP